MRLLFNVHWEKSKLLSLPTFIEGLKFKNNLMFRLHAVYWSPKLNILPTSRRSMVWLKIQKLNLPRINLPKFQTSSSFHLFRPPIQIAKIQYLLRVQNAILKLSKPANSFRPSTCPLKWSNVFNIFTSTKCDPKIVQTCQPLPLINV